MHIGSGVWLLVSQLSMAKSYRQLASMYAVYAVYAWYVAWRTGWRTNPYLSSSQAYGVSFRYSAEHPWVLKGLNLSIPANQCTALVGLNGEGKSTIVKLLTRMYDPDEGRILWDGIDIREFEVEAFRERIGAVFQDFSRYDLTVQENIGLGNVHNIRNKESIQKAAKQAGISKAISVLPAGYETVLSRWLALEGTGVDLSGGQWQKIALARLFMKECSLLILDEPTSALDAQAEHELYDQFSQLMSGRTCLLITHRFSTVRMADMIVVIDGGLVSEFGSHEDLISRNQKYAALYNMQAAYYR